MTASLLLDGLAGYWKLNEGSGSSVTDYSGNGKNGILVNSPTWDTTDVPPLYIPPVASLTFSGIGTLTYVIAPRGSLTDNIFLNGGSVLFWIRPTSVPTVSNRIIAKELVGSVGWLCGLENISGNNVFIFEQRFTSVAYVVEYFSNIIPVNTWTQIVLTYTASSGSAHATVYINGVAVTGSHTNGSGSVISDATSDIIIGAVTSATTRTYGGQISDVRLYNRILTATEVSVLAKGGLGATLITGAGVSKSSRALNEDGLMGYWKFDEGGGTTAVDSSGMGNNGTYTNSPTWTSSIASIIKFPDPYAVILNGSSQYVSVPDSASLRIGNVFSISSWVKTSSIAANNSIIVDKVVYNASLQADYRLYCVSSTHKASGFIRDAAGNSSTVTSTSNIDDGAWHHVVITNNGSSFKLYFDGSLQATSSSTSVGSTDDTTANLQIGRYVRSNDTSGDNWFNGSIDDVRLYNRVLSAAEITNLASGYLCGSAGSVIKAGEIY